MKNRKHIFGIIILLVCIFSHSGLKSQPVKKFNLVEKFQLLTDRALYSAGERVYFSAMETTLSKHAEIQLSEVLYVDIITPSGQIIHSSKHPLINGYAKGSADIPEDASTGSYYLRCYTRWMRNYDYLQMSYISIKIINSSKNAQLPVQPLDGNNYELEKIDSQIVSMDLKITSDMPVYGLREEVNIRLESDNIDRSLYPMVISVLPVGAETGQVRNGSPRDQAYLKDLKLLPETRGISISGKVRNRENNNFEAFSPVFMTLLDPERNFYPGITDTSGSFHFSLPDYHGEKDLFISVKDTEDKPLEVLIDRDFTLDHSILPSFRINLDSLEYKTALDIVRNQQLKSLYYPHENMQETQKADTVFFYGIPSLSLDVEFYIDLPSLEEYFLELIPVVSITRSHGVPHFRVNGPQAEMKIYDPLVMIDGVVIHDNEALLKIDPENIEKIDIVDRPWIRGDIIFGGIISLHSRRNDFAGVDLPESGLFLTYRFFEPENPLPQENVPMDDHLPDVRNTLYWNPELIIRPGETREIRFRTGDITGDYLILVRQVRENGQIYESTHRFRVE